MKTGCVIQARMTSSRLPGKVLKTIDFERGISVLEQVVSRVKCVPSIDTIIVATTVNADDDPVEELVGRMGVEVFRGSEKDVLERYYLAAEKNGLDHVIRITSDCPFLDPQVIERLINLYFDEGAQYGSNCIRRTYPHGLDCEIVGFDTLKKIYETQSDSFYREHVTSYITSHLEDFRTCSLEDEEDNSSIRVTVDTVNDYILSCVLNEIIMREPDPMSFRTLIRCFKERPYLPMINGDILQKKKYDSREEEAEAAVSMLKMQEMNRAADMLQVALQTSSGEKQI